MYPCAGQAGADAAKAGPGSKQAGVMLQRSKWTAQVGLVLHSQVPSPLAGYVLPPGLFLNPLPLPSFNGLCHDSMSKAPQRVTLSSVRRQCWSG